EHGQQLAADLDRLGPLGRAARVDVQPDDPGGGQHGDPGQQPQAGDGDGHGGPGHVPGLPLAAGAADLDEPGHEDGGQDPAQDQLVDDVGGGVGDVVDVGQAALADAEGGDQHGDPEQPGDPRQQRAGGHQGGRPDQAGLLGHLAAARIA